MIRTSFLIAAFALTAVPVRAEEKKAEPKAFASQTEAINHYIREGYAKAKITAPAARATDTEFLRRAFIDLIGRNATIDEVLDFEQDSSTNKRAKLVARLLNGTTKGTAYIPKVNGQAAKVDEELYNYNDQFGTHWANIWTTWLMTRSGHRTYREGMKAWLENELIVNNTNHKEMVTKLLTATGESNKNGAVNFIIHHLGEATPKDKNDVGAFDAIPITSRVTRLFLGIQTNCTQCHDHPFNKEWVQSDFWGVNAYFRQTMRDRTPTGSADRRQMDNPVKVTLSDDPNRNEQQIIYYERRDGKLMASKPNFLKDLALADSAEPNSKPLPKGAKTRREALAEYVTSHDNFARAYVNRLWGHFFGRGLNKEPTLDDFGSHNEVVHPELLDYLAKEFVKYNYDSKKLMEWICTSEAYSLSHVANPAYVDQKYEAYFARMPLKALSPEVLYESLRVVAKAESGPDRDVRNRNRQSFIQKLVQNFGDDEGNEMTFNGTVVQALLMMNGVEINNAISRKSGESAVNQIIARHTKNGAIASAATIDEIYLAVLNRHPTAAETTKINAVMNKGATIPGEAAPKEKKDEKPAAKPEKPAEKTEKPAEKTEKSESPAKPAQPPGKGPNRKNPMAPQANGPRAVMSTGPNDPTFYQDLFWALLNTNEFMLNH